MASKIEKRPAAKKQTVIPQVFLKPLIAAEQQGRPRVTRVAKKTKRPSQATETMEQSPGDPVIAKKPRAASKPARIRIVNFSELYKATPDQRVHWIRSGVPATDIKTLAQRMETPQDKIFKILHLSPATINRKASRNEDLSAEDSERVVGMAKLIGQVESMLEESGDPHLMKDFDAAKWVAHWLEEPIPALGGACPASYMDTMEGQRMVSNLLTMMQSGAYA